jgi:hypothetical protein
MCYRIRGVFCREGIMFRACSAFAFVLTLATFGFSQTNSEKASQVPGVSQPLPSSPKAVKDSAVAADSLKARKARRKAKAAAKTASADSAKAAQKETKAPAKAPGTTPPADTAKAAAPAVPGAGSVRPADSAKAAAPSPVESVDSTNGPTSVAIEEKPTEVKRAPQDIRLFNDPQLIAKEYGFGILGSVVAGALGFYIGSGIETAIEGESNAHKGTLKFTGIRYDNYKGAFWGGATGMVVGSALTTYFMGQMDEEDGGLLLTLAGTAAAGAGAFYIAHLAGANDDIDWKPFIPLLAIPSLGGTLGFNVSRWLHDRKREEVIGHEASVWLHPPGLAWGRTEGGDRLEIRALNLTF